MRRKVDRSELTVFARWLDAAIEANGTNLKRVSDAVDSDYTYLWKVLHGHVAKYAQYQRPGFEVTLNLGRHLNDVGGALKAANYTEEYFAGNSATHPVLNPDTARLVEAYNNAAPPIKKTFDALADSVEPADPAERKSAAEIAEALDRDESIGKRA